MQAMAAPRSTPVPGNDTIHGPAGNNVIYGGPGDNLISGGSGNDTIFGGPGNNILRGGPGHDLIHSGTGSDTFVFAPGDEITSVSGFSVSDGDRLRLYADLWGGELTAHQVVDAFGELRPNGHFLFQFGDESLWLLNFAGTGLDPSALADHIDIL